MDELIDILDSKGNFTGKTAMKSEAHKHGWFHNTVHIWFYTPNGKVLLQQRGRNKDTYPLLWDVSVAGHVGAGEEIETAALREVEEEIGLSIIKGKLQRLGVFKSVQKHTEQLNDCEFHHTFLYELENPLEKLRKQDSEVEDLKLMPLLQFSEETWGMANLKKYVPHDIDYYAAIIKGIKGNLEHL